MLETYVVFVVIVLLCLERVGGWGKGRGRDRGYFSTKTVLRDTCDFSLLSFNVRVCCAIYESESESESESLLSQYRFTRKFVLRCTVSDIINNNNLTRLQRLKIHETHNRLFSQHVSSSSDGLSHSKPWYSKEREVTFLSLQQFQCHTDSGFWSMPSNWVSTQQCTLNESRSRVLFQCWRWNEFNENSK